MSIYVKDKNGEIQKVGMVTNVGYDQAIDDMWDYIQCFGTRTSYGDFSRNMIFTKKNLKPKYNVVVTSAYNMFFGMPAIADSKQIEEGLIVMKELEEEQGIVFDFSQCTNFDNAFRQCPFSELNVIDVSKPSTLNYTFYYSQNEKLPRFRRIERLIIGENTKFSSTFGYSSNIEHIGFEGLIAQNGLDLNWSTKLDKESHIKLINALSSSTSGLSVTLSKTAVNKAFETSSGANDGPTSSEWLNLIATKSNWTISLS